MKVPAAAWGAAKGLLWGCLLLSWLLSPIKKEVLGEACCMGSRGKGHSYPALGLGYGRSRLAGEGVWGPASLGPVPAQAAEEGQVSDQSLLGSAPAKTCLNQLLLAGAGSPARPSSAFASLVSARLQSKGEAGLCVLAAKGARLFCNHGPQPLPIFRHAAAGGALGGARGE